MKVNLGFISNSSSCSFLVAYDGNKRHLKHFLDELLTKMCSNGKVFKSATILTESEAFIVEGEAQEYWGQRDPYTKEDPDGICGVKHRNITEVYERGGAVIRFEVEQDCDEDAISFISNIMGFYICYQWGI